MPSQPSGSIVTKATRSTFFFGAILQLPCFVHLVERNFTKQMYFALLVALKLNARNLKMKSRRPLIERNDFHSLLAILKQVGRKKGGSIFVLPPEAKLQKGNFERGS
jgi:hypothetical protein